MTTEELMRYIHEPTIHQAFYLTELLMADGEPISTPYYLSDSAAENLVNDMLKALEAKDYDLETINWNVSISGDTLYFLLTNPIRH